MQPVNLIPADCLDNWTRRRRVTFWTAVCLIAAVVAIVAAGQRWNSGRSIAKLERRVTELNARQFDLERSLVLAGGKHDALLAKAEAVASLHRPNYLPDQFATLSNVAPEGVVFTRIDVRAATPQMMTRPGAKLAGTRPGARDAVATEMTGYAVNHQELDRLINAIHAIPQWRQVRLLRAANEPYLSGQAIAFHLVCMPEEQEQ